MNLVLVRRVRANHLASMKAECLTAWGPGTRSRAPGGRGRALAGVRGKRPGSSWV